MTRQVIDGNTATPSTTSRTRGLDPIPRRAKAPGLGFRTVTSTEQIASLRDQWKRLPQAYADPLLSHSWLTSASEALGGSGGLRFVVGERGNELEACAPLQETRRMGVAWLEVVGSSVLGEPAGLLFRNETVLDGLCAYLAGMSRPLVLGRVPSGLRLAERLRRHRRGWTMRVPSPPAMQVLFDHGWDSYLAGRSTECRSGFPRKRRKLAQLGKIGVERHRPLPGSVESVLSRSFEIENDGWKRRSGSSVLKRPALRQFLLEVGRRFATEGKLLVYFLTVGSRSVATIVAVEHDARIWELKVGYREAFSGASPGRLLLWEVLRDGFERGLAGYEFLGSGDGQQGDWANSERKLETVVFYPYSLSGARALGSDLVGHLGRRIGKIGPGR